MGCNMALLPLSSASVPLVVKRHVKYDCPATASLRNMLSFNFKLITFATYHNNFDVRVNFQFFSEF
jgi:hypothetical protein